MVRSVSSATVSAVKPPTWLMASTRHALKSAGNDRNTIQQVERTFFEILASHIFKRLPASEPTDAISNFHVARYGSSTRGLTKCRTSLLIAAGSTEVSASMVTIMSLEASAKA